VSHLEATWWKPLSLKQPSAVGSRVTAESGGSVAFWALVAFTAILLLSPQAWMPALKVIRIAFLAAGLAMAAHITERTIRRQSITPMSPEIGIVLVLVAWAVLTLPMSIWPGGSVRVLTDNYLKAVAFFWLLGTIITSTERLRRLAWTLVLCSIPLAVTGIHNYLSGDVLSTGVSGFYRIEGYVGQGGSGLTGNPNDLALMLNLIIPIAGVLVFISRGFARLVALGALLVAVAAVVLTFSRAGFMTLAASFVMFLAVLARRKAPGAAFGLLLLAVCVPPMLPQGYVARLSTITNIESDATGSAQGRWRDLQAAVEVVAKNPVIGAGIGQDILAMNAQRGDDWTQVHNAYLQYAVDLGVPGVVLFAWLHLLCYRTARAVEKRAARQPAHRHLTLLAAGVQVSLVAFFVAAMFHPIAYQFYFFSIGGLAVALRNIWHAENGLVPAAGTAPGVPA
jgi:probable O-glycosylation ligase (exosortase A-associated)